MRIAVLQFTHETVTFLPVETTRHDFIYPGSPASGEALLATDPKGYMGGFVQVAREYDDVELVGITSPLWPRTGTGSGWITRDAYEHFLGIMLAELRAEHGLDGVYLALHGAMAVRGVPRPEADIARRVREALGPGVKLSATFDPHGNEDESFLRYADMAFCVKYFPHYDMHLQGERAARMLVRAIRGTFRPAHRTLDVPIIAPTVVMWTGASPWSDLVQRALTWEAREPDVYVNVFFGFPWSDVPDAGMSLQVLTNDDPALAERVLADMADWTWRRREALLNAVTVHGMADGVRLAREAVGAGCSPVVLADYSDRSGAATWLLREVLDQALERTLVATIASPDVVQQLLATGVAVGDPFDGEIGGRFDPSAGEPVRITGTILHVGRGHDRPGPGPRLDLRRLRARQRGDPQPLPGPDRRTVGAVGVRPQAGGLRRGRDQVPRAFPARLRRQRLRADDPPGRAAPAVHGHGAPRRAPLRGPEPGALLPLRCAELSVASGRRSRTTALTGTTRRPRSSGPLARDL